MKRLLVIALVCAFPLSCLRSPDHVPSATNVNQPPQELSVAPRANATGELATASSTPIPDLGVPDVAIAYPEKSDVLAMLYRAREMRQQWQFESALALVSHALALDPSSPMAQSMEREIAEILKRLRDPGTQHRTRVLRYAA
ncbi:hypothetical protein [Schlesneria paludicola]|uniref:hypothetical protein n=1 Tax=Schlesneria paludicola TaxID=360056 RepID=UPI0012FB7820|nr:hypothetical protein [Schlesneria paludicola]